VSIHATFQRLPWCVERWVYLF